MPQWDVSLLYAKVVELDKPYLVSDNYFKMHSVSFEKYYKWNLYNIKCMKRNNFFNY